MMGRSRFSFPKSAPAVSLQRVRVRLARSGPAALVTHIQQIDRIRRALTASLWPVLKSGAKRNKIRVSFGPAISVGYESEAEYFDVELSARLTPTMSRDALQEQLPDGFSVVQVKSIPRFFPSLEASVNTAFYEISSEDLKGTKDRWESFWKKDSFIVIKKKSDREEAIDARQLVRAWQLEGGVLHLELRFGPKRTLKPERLIQAVCDLPEHEIIMGQPDTRFKIKRTRLCLEKAGGDLIDP